MGRTRFTPLPEERILDVQPRFDPQVTGPTPRRLNYQAGRSLTAQALISEQFAWDRKIALLGRALTPGAVRGLEVELLSTEAGSARIRLTSGLGITAMGEDVSLPQGLSARLDDISAAEPLLEAQAEPRGVVGLFLQPIRAVQANGRDPEDPCPIDLEAYAYDDITTLDGVRLVWATLTGHQSASLPANADDRPRPVPMQGGDGSLQELGHLSSTHVELPADPILGRTDPLLVAASVRRNILAQRLISEEETAIRRGQVPLWQTHGLPLALAEIDPSGEVLWFDRFALARAGGALRKANPIRAFGLTDQLRRARFDQFVDQLQALRSEGAQLTPGTEFFRHLPPVGVLPAELLDSQTLTCDFFPPSYAAEAAPVQLSQFESILAARSGLAPFDLARADYVQLLVPVPDHLYDPRLLYQETIAPEFQEAITAAALSEAQARAVFEQLETAQAWAIGLVNLADVDAQTHANPNPGSDAEAAIAESQTILSQTYDAAMQVPLAPDEHSLIEPYDYARAMSDLVQGSTPQDVQFRGLKPLTALLETRIAKANDLMDMSFLRLQSDIYRVRKQLVGESDATRLATSPVLANLAGSTTSLELGKIFNIGAYDAPIPGFTLSRDFQREEAVVADLQDPASNMSDFGLTAYTDSYSPSFGYDIGFDTTLTGTVGPVTTTTFEGLAPIAMTTNAPVQTSKGFALDLSAFGVSSIRADIEKTLVTSSDVALQGLIYGKSAPIRTATIAERLRPSPAQEAKNAAVATKAKVIQALQELGMNLSGLRLPVSASRVTLVEASVVTGEATQLSNRGEAAAAAILNDDGLIPVYDGVAVVMDTRVLRSAGNNLASVLRASLSAIYDQRLSLDYDGLSALVLADRLDPDPTDGDEGAYFAAAVDALESAVSLLRLAEGRVQSYTGFLSTLREFAVQAISLAEEITDAQDLRQAQIDEAVHDQAVASALMTEEQARIDTLNARRQDILEKHVDLFGFARPMAVNRLTQAPGMPLYRPQEELLPACLDRGADLPDELEDLLDAFRDAPIGWFPEVAKQLEKLRRLSDYTNAWRYAYDRAGLWLGQSQNQGLRLRYSPAQLRVAGKATQGVYGALQAMAQTRQTFWQSRRAYDPTRLSGLSWRELYLLSRDRLSLEDLARTGKTGTKLARDGLEMIDQIGALAACFLDGLRALPATTRLDWAETLSVHDDAPDLTDLTRAAGWSGLPYEERRNLEYLHRWMLSKVDLRNEAARDAMSTLTRVCLLMSSHAPVSELVEGTVSETATLTVGDVSFIDISRGTPAIGLVVRFGNTSRAARAVVEDIIGGRAMVRVTETVGTSVSVSATTPVTFARPTRVQGLRFKQAGMMRR